MEQEQIVSEPLDVQAAMKTLGELMARVRPLKYATLEDHGLAMLHRTLAGAHEQVAFIAHVRAVGDGKELASARSEISALRIERDMARRQRDVYAAQIKDVRSAVQS